MLNLEVLVTLRSGRNLTFMVQGISYLAALESAEELLEDIDYAVVQFNPLN